MLNLKLAYFVFSNLNKILVVLSYAQVMHFFLNNQTRLTDASYSLSNAICGGLTCSS